ncbi:sulfatase family protein [Alienimonas chondri]|uniref:Arylsulfatase n=1 Tax=Alienimonas chondri TaxID=2681879 RepID=A0ABX1VDL5_9PLAN|nr:arylsulfatase [Alienimonas chondri]NNJ26010.1 Arylsulfatase [Alienimonas chondri]
MLPLALLTAAVLAPADPVDQRPADQRPNVVVILADDMGYGDVGANNPASKIPTPHLDRLAKAGTRFTDAHSPASWCTPTRYSLLTGKYSQRGRPWKWAGPPQIAADTPTLPGVFQAAGYRTAMVGKWHLGFVTPEGEPLGEDRDVEHRGGPADRGFDSYFGIDVSLDGPPYYYIRDRRAVVLPTDEIGPGSSPAWTKIQGDFWRGGGIAPGFAHQKVLPDFRDEAASLVTDLAAEANDGGKPFLMYLAFASPHTPWAVTGNPVDYPGGAALYGQFVNETDAAIGAVLQALEESGAAENTLVVFTSDNGPVWYDADEEKYDHLSAGGFRGMKGDAYEGGHRMPFFVAGPGVEAGATSDALTLHTDLLPTLAAACGVELPAGAAPDAVNQWPVWSGATTLAPGKRGPRTEALFEASGGKDFVRVDDAEGRWKLIPWRGSGGFTPPRKIDPQPGEPIGQLYDLADDPDESDNRYLDLPEKVAELTAALERLQMSGEPEHGE